MAGPVDVLRNARGRPTSTRSNLSNLSELGPNSAKESTKAFKGLFEARSEGAWLDAKFQRSGHPDPNEGEMTVVIEYCYNSNSRQLSTHHNEQRYHEEAELVRQYVLHYSPEARVFIVPADFSKATSIHRGGEARLGAFEIDARIRVDGELLTVNLWSKLNTKLWPVWPDWQDNLRQLLPVFELLVRPCAELDDGAIVYIHGSPANPLTCTILNYDKTLTVASGPINSSNGGLLVRLMRGTYTIQLPETNDYFAETAELALARVPAPIADSPVELKVPMFAKPRLKTKLDMDFDASGVLRYCDAKVEDVLIRATDARTGELIYQGPPPEPGKQLNMDLNEWKHKIVMPTAGLADNLADAFAQHARKSKLRTSSLETQRARSRPAAPGMPSGAWPPDESEEAEPAEEAKAEPALPLSALPPEGWEIKLEASLPKYPNAPLDPRVASKTVRLLKGGAPETKLQLARASRPVIVSISTPEAFTDRWCRNLRLPPLRVEVKHATTGQLVCAGDAVVPTAGKQAGEPVAALLRLPEDLVLNEMYKFVLPPSDVTHAAAETMTVHRGDGPLQVALVPERVSCDVRVRWTMTNARQEHWSVGLPLPEGFVYNVYHRDTEALVLSATYNSRLALDSRAGEAGYTAAGSVDAPFVTELVGEGALFQGESYLLEVVASAGVQAAQAVFTVGQEPRDRDGRTTFSVPLHRAFCSLQLRLRSDLANSGHWAAPLLPPPGLSFHVAHATLGKKVASGTTDGQGNAMLSGHDALYVNQRYVVHLAESPFVHAGHSEFVASEGVTPVELPLKRKAVGLRVQLHSAHAGTEHWSAPLALPTAIALRVRHKRLGAVVLSCAADAQGGAMLGDQAGFFVGEVYTIEAPASAQIKAASADFTVSAAAQLVPLAVERATADVTLAMRIQQPAGLAHAYAALLASPVGVRYTVWHRGRHQEVGSGYTDQAAKAVLRRKDTLFVGEEYEVRTEGGNGIKEASQAFVVAAHHSEVVLPIERARAHLEFEMVSSVAGSAHWAGSLPLPKDIGFEVRHATSGSLVFSGVANPAARPDAAVVDAFKQFDRDASGLLEMREVGPVLSHLGLQADEAVMYEVGRRYDTSTDGKLDLMEFARLVSEVQAYRQMGGANASSFAVGQGTSAVRCQVDGNLAGLYVGEPYQLVVPCTELFDESSVDFAVSDQHHTSCILQLRRAAADLGVTLHSTTAGKQHWAATLPLPGGISYRVVHKQLGVVVSAGTTGIDSHSILPAAGGAVLVGERYQLQVERTDSFRMADGEAARSFFVAGRSHEASLQLMRQGGSVELLFKSAKAGTAHWSSPLPLPVGIAFNVYHKHLACVVLNGCTTSRGNFMTDGVDALFVGEAYVLEVRAASREFTVTAAPQQLPVLVERASGRVMVHVSSNEANLATLLPGLTLSLRHKQLGVLVASPLTLCGDRAELLGDDALLVGQTYVCEVSEHPALMPCHTEFTVQPQPVRVELMLERAPATVSLVFRAASGDSNLSPCGEPDKPSFAHPLVPTSPSKPKLQHQRSGCRSQGSAWPSFMSAAGAGASTKSRSASSRGSEGDAPRSGTDWATGVALPAGIRFEVRHKQTDQLVASGQTKIAEHAPRVALQTGRLFAKETYVVHVLAGDFVEASVCEFLARGDGEHQEVSLLVRRLCGAVTVHFVSYEFGANHWASSLQLPPDVRFEVRHKATSALAFAGVAGPSNRVTLPSAGVLFVGELFVLHALSSRLLRGGSVEFTARSISQEVELALERAIGDVSLSLRSPDGRPLPPGIPFKVWHQQLQNVVCEGKTSLSATEVPCDPWFINEGALYSGESYVFGVPAGNGWKMTAVSFVVGEAGQVQLELIREEGQVMLHLVNGQSGTGHWSERLPLPRDLLVFVRLSGDDERHGKPLRPESMQEKAARAIINVNQALSGMLLAHERYVFALQASELVLPRQVELQLGSSNEPSSIELRVPRAWKPAIVAVLTTSDHIALPSGIHLRAMHTGLGETVAEATTDISGIEVRCVMKAHEAFFIGEAYEVHVDAGHGIASATQAFSVVAQAGANVTGGRGADVDVVLQLGRATGELSVRLFPARFGTDHWAAKLPLPPQQLEVLQQGQLVATTTVQWLHATPERIIELSTLASLFVGQQYTVRVAQSDSVLPVNLQAVIEHIPQLLPMPLPRVWHCAHVTLRSRQELPIPFGVRVEVRHKALNVVVASAATGDEEAHEYEQRLEAAQMAQRGAESSAQTDQALSKLAAFMKDKEIYFAGAGDDECTSVEQAWAIEHPRMAYAKQNAKTLEGIAEILKEFEAVMLEVRGETGPAEHAPERLAAHFQLDRTQSVQLIMDKLARQRAIACVGALVELGVPQERIFVTAQGRAGGVRTDFIPHSMSDNAKRAMSASKRLAGVAAELGDVQFHAAADLGLPSAATHWSVEHLDPGVRAKNLAVLHAVAGVMKDYPELRLEINCQTAPRLELPPASDGEALRAPEALCARFNLHALEVDAVADRLAQLRVEALMKALMEEGLPEPQLLGTFNGTAAESRVSFSARSSTWRDAQETAKARAEEPPPPGSQDAQADLRPAQKRMRALLKSGSIAWNSPTEAAANAIEQAWDVAHLQPETNAANAQVLDALAALLFEYPHSRLVVHIETLHANSALPTLAVHFDKHPKREAAEVHEQLARRRGAAVVAALKQRGVPAARLSLAAKAMGGAIHADFDLRPIPTGQRSLVRKSTALLLEGQKLARIQRHSSVLLGRESKQGLPQFAQVTKPVSTSAWISTPDALFVGEKYILESVACRSLGVPRCALEFVMPAHDEELELYLDRPTGNINVQLVYRKANTGHWSAPLPLPPSATFRVRHATVGIVLPETRIDGTFGLPAGAEGSALTVADQTWQSASESLSVENVALPTSS